MVFDQQTAFLRYIRWRNIEVLRGVYAAVRDRDWNTVPFEVIDFDYSQITDHIHIQWTARSTDSQIGFQWMGEIIGEPGRVTFRFDGRVLRDFWKNRIGICTLHPLDGCVGQQVSVEHTDGSQQSQAAFPQWIAPHQPFKHIRSLTHFIAPEVRAKVSFSGEEFEMEDQRNWTDASFKTYCTPLEKPFPVKVLAGTRIEQAVTLELIDDSGEASSLRGPATLGSLPVSSPVPLRIEWQLARPLPAIGVELLDAEEFERSMSYSEVVTSLKALRLAHLRMELDPFSDGWACRARAGRAVAAALDCKLEVVLFADGERALPWREISELFNDFPDALARWLVFDRRSRATPEALARSAVEHLLPVDDQVPIVCGTNAYYAELNRHRPRLPNAASVVFSMNPQVHAFDKLSLCESLEAQKSTVDSAERAFACPIVVSPITLKPRFNPNATSTSDCEWSTEREIDLRQAEGFSAAWSLGSLAQLATHPATASLTYYETHGPRGIMDATGEPYPVYSVFRWLADSAAIAPAVSADRLAVVALGLLDRKGKRTVLLGNLSSEVRDVQLHERDGAEHKLQLGPESVRQLIF